MRARAWRRCFDRRVLAGQRWEQPEGRALLAVGRGRCRSRSNAFNDNGVVYDREQQGNPYDELSLAPIALISLEHPGVRGNHSAFQVTAMPCVSVVIAVYNGEDYLAEALTSVFSQSRPPDEVIVVDDGSTDRSGTIASAFAGVRCLRQANAGQAAALNAGVAASRGDFLAFVDADDRWVPDKLALQLAAANQEPELEVVFGYARQFFEGRAAIAAPVAPRPLPARLVSAMLVRRRTWFRVGPMSSEWAVGSIIDWCARADDLRVRTKMLDVVVYERRVHGRNLGLTHPESRRDYARVLKRVLDRRRALDHGPAKGSADD